MSNEMKAAVYSGVNTVENIVRAIPKPKNGEILIKVEACAICITQMPQLSLES